MKPKQLASFQIKALVLAALMVAASTFQLLSMKW